MNTSIKLQKIISEIIHVPFEDISSNMPLIGEYAELDSMGIMTLLMEIEDNFAINIDDIDLSIETFASVESLKYAVERAKNMLGAA